MYIFEIYNVLYKMYKMRDKVQKVAALGAVVRDFESKDLGSVPVDNPFTLPV